MLSVCGELQTYAPDGIRHWHELVQTADRIRPMMGISPSAWADAMETMGPEKASVVLCAMLEKFDSIRSPGGYLRALTRKAAEDGFSSGPMVMALITDRAA
ncbi:MAG: replication initiation protein RepC [Yoonia sp.]|nr:replication initiation protein RepC [Yoonia sp.]